MYTCTCNHGTAPEGGLDGSAVIFPSYRGKRGWQDDVSEQQRERERRGKETEGGVIIVHGQEVNTHINKDDTENSSYLPKVQLA